MNINRDIKEQEKPINFSTVYNDLEEGKFNIQKATSRYRYTIANYIKEKAKKAIAKGPEEISDITVRKSDVKELTRDFAKIMNGLFDKGSLEIDKEIERQRRQPLSLRDEDMEISEIKELFLARAKAMAVDITFKIERSAQLFAEDLWRTKGVDGLTNVDLDRMVDQIVTVVDREGKYLSIKNTSESYSLGRHFKAMKYKDDIAYAYYSALLDENTCEECAAVDGQIVDVGSPLYYDLMPPHRECLGRGACRCMYIYIMKDEVLANDAPKKSVLTCTSTQESMKLHYPGGKSHNQKNHGIREVGAWLLHDGQTGEEKSARIIHGDKELSTAESNMIKRDWTERPYVEIEALRNRSMQGKSTFSDNQVINAIRDCPEYNGPMYRGMSFNHRDPQSSRAYDSIKKTFVEGAEVSVPISSFSSSRGVGLEFTGLSAGLNFGKGGQAVIAKSEAGIAGLPARQWSFSNKNTDHVVIKATSKAGKSIKEHSTYTQEAEIVSMPNTRYRVTGTKTITQSNQEMQKNSQNVSPTGRNITKPNELHIIEMEEL